MIGLGVGIDYALFIVTRFRESYVALGDVERSVLEAMDTSGRAILLAGTTVVIALLGMFATGVNFMYGLAIASVLAVLLTLVASLTVLPALLSRWGQRLVPAPDEGHRAEVAAGKGPDGGARRGGSRSRWRRWSETVQARLAVGDRVAGGDDRAAAARVRDAAGYERRGQRSGEHEHSATRSTCSRRASARASTGRCWSWRELPQRAARRPAVRAIRSP